jgi:hypothetical protein
MKGVSVVLAILVLFMGGGASAGGRAAPRLTLTALADIGTVFWRYDCSARSAEQRRSVGIRLYESATTNVVFESGKLTLRAELQPGTLHWFPFRADRVQRLRATQSTEPGTLRALVTIDFGYRHGVAHCYSYAPPRFTVQEYPR